MNIDLRTAFFRFYAHPAFGDFGRRVRDLARKGEWEKVYGQLNAAETIAADNGADDVSRAHYGFGLWAARMAGMNNWGDKSAQHVIREPAVQALMAA